MSTANTVAEWIGDHSAGEEFRRTVFAEKGEAVRAGFDSSATDTVQGSRAPVVPARPEPLGTAGGLSESLAAMMRLAYVGPRDRERAWANADRLLETIRVLSIL